MTETTETTGRRRATFNELEVAEVTDDGSPRGERLVALWNPPLVDAGTGARASGHKVTAALNKGWRLHGSPTYAYDAKTKTMACGQAVVKEVEGKDYTPDMKLGEQ